MFETCVRSVPNFVGGGRRCLETTPNYALAIVIAAVIIAAALVAVAMITRRRRDGQGIPEIDEARLHAAIDRAAAERGIEV